MSYNPWGGCQRDHFSPCQLAKVYDVLFECRDNLCITPEDPIVSNPASVCYGSALPTLSADITLNLNRTNTGGCVSWFDAASGGNELASQTATFMPTYGTGLGQISGSGTYEYWVQDVGLFNTGCVSNRVKITLTITSPPDAEFSYPQTVYCTSGTDPSPQHNTGTGGSYTATPVGLVISVVTGVIDLSASSTGTYTVTNTVSSSGCADDTHTFNVEIVTQPDAEFSYASTSYCVTGPSDPTPQHTTGSDGTYSSTAGLSINAGTGQIDLSASTPGTYTVTNTLTVSGCPTDVETFNVTITPPPDAEFSYAQTVYCTSGTDPSPQHTTGVDGTYSSTAGLSINAATGVIDLSASSTGTYTVTNTVSATGCADDTHTFNVQIVTQPDAEFSYASTSYCVTGPTDPTPQHSTGSDGTYSSTAGLSINGATGQIDLSASTPGAYTVTNTLTVSGCPTDVETFDVTITPPPDAEFSYAQTVYCTSGIDPSPQHTTGVDGTYSSTAGLSINAATGVIDLSASSTGTYTVTNTVSSSGCADDTHTFDVEIVTQPDAEFSYASTSYCVTGPVNPTPQHTTGTDGTYSSTAGLSIDGVTGEITLSTSTPGTYTVTNTLTVPGCPTDVHTFDVTITPPLDAGTALPAVEVCNIATASVVILNDLLVGEDIGSWSETSAVPSTGGAFNAVAGTFSPIGQAAGTYTFEYLVSNGGVCADDTETVSVIIIPQCCPSLTSFGASPMNVCDGEMVAFSVVLDAGALQEGVDYTVAWTGPSGGLSTGNEGMLMSYMGTDNCTETQTYTLTVFCNNSGQTVINETVDVMVSPPLTALPVDEGECVVSIAPACATWLVSWDDGQGNTGIGDTYDGNAVGTQTGTVMFTVTNPDGAAACASDVFDVDFECCIADAGVLMLANDALCPGDDIEASTGGTHQMDADYTHAYLLVDATTGMIVDMNATGVFSGMASNVDYEVYSYSQSLTLPPTPVAGTGTSLANIGLQDMGCFDLDGSGVVFYPDDFAVGASVNTTQTPPYLYNTSQITITGGTLPYNYDWSTSGYVRYAIPSLGLVNVIYDNPALWTLTVTDANGCNTSEMVFGNNIPGAQALSISNYNVLPDTGGGTGEVDITIVGGSGAGTYSHTWTSTLDPAFSETTQDISNLPSGWYIVTVTDQSVPQQSAVGVYWVPAASGGSISGGFTRNKLALNEGCFIEAVPNPVSEATILTFATLADDVATIEIFDVAGKSVKHFAGLETRANRPEKLDLPMSDLGGAGIYILRLTSERGYSAITRLVVLNGK